MATITGGSFTSTPCIARTTTSSDVLLASLFLRSRSSRIRVSILATPFNRPAVISTYGGGGGGGGGRPQAPSDSRRSRKNESNDGDGAMDLSLIRAATVRLIDEQQNMVGVVSKSEAIQMAEDAELDLDYDNLVAKICIIKGLVLSSTIESKFRYEQQKRKREQQKKSAASRMDLKELKMGYNIDQHDYSVRLKAAQKFLKDGDKVKVIVNLKGRENDFRNIAIELIRRFQSDVGELATEEGKSFRDRNIFIVLVPNKAVLQKSQDPPKNRDKSSSKEVSAKT